MGLFSKKQNNQPEMKLEYTFRKCVGFVGDEISEFYGVRSIDILERSNKKSLLIPPTFNGLPVRVIFGRALANWRLPNINIHSNIIAINANQGYTDGGGPNVELYHFFWRLAIFTYDENHEIFKPLSFVPSDLTYGMIGYVPSKGIPLRALDGDGKTITGYTEYKHASLIQYDDYLRCDGAHVDWDNHVKFIVRKEYTDIPLVFKVIEKNEKGIFDSAGNPIN